MGLIISIFRHKAVHPPPNFADLSSVISKIFPELSLMKKLFSPGGIRLLTATAVLLLASHAAEAQCGKASWYALHSKTASGERMNPSAMTAAHRSLPFGTRLKVTNQRNGKSVVVRINDRGPFIKGRMLDLSRGAARRIGMIKAGHVSVCTARL